jgi:CBS domain-containing protein
MRAHDVRIAGAAGAAATVTARSDEPLRVVVHRMAETGCTSVTVVDGADPAHPVGTITLEDVLKARVRHLEEERRREGIVPIDVVPLGRRLFNGSRRAAR